jgi:hypothetical protein
VVSSSGFEIDRPALLTTRSTPPKASTAAANAAAIVFLAGHVGGHRDRRVAPPSSGGDGRGRLRVPVGDDHARALGGQPLRDRLADP